MKYVFTLFALTLAIASTAQTENKSKLVLSEIMKGDEFIGHQPNSVRWTRDSKTILFDWNPENNPGDETYGYSLTAEKTSKILPKFYSVNTDRFLNSPKYSKYEFYSRNGGLYRFDLRTKETILLYQGSSSVRNVMRTNEGMEVYFQMGSDIYVYDMVRNSIHIILQFKKGSEPVESKPSKLSEEELSLFKFHQENEAKKKWNESQDDIWETEIPKVYHQSFTLGSVQISPDSRYLTFRLNNYPSSQKTHVEHHISSDGYTYTSDARRKVSEEDPTHKLGIYDRVLDTTYYVDFSSLTDIRKKPAYYSEYGDEEPEFKEDRKIVMHRMQFSPNGERTAFDIRSYDNKDRWIVSLNLKTGTISEFEHQHDEAWIGGPGISNWNMVSGTLGWLHDNTTVYFQSEETGYSHLYTYNVDSKKKIALTKGNWEIYDVELNKTGTKFFITANKTHPGDRGFYHYSIRDKELIPVLTDPGNFEVSVSPDEKYLAVRYSYKNKPWELFMVLNKPNAAMRKITNSTSEEFEAYDWYAPEVITFKASDGVNVNARLYSPEKENSNGAAVVFVHGAGYLQNAHNFWSGYHREFMFHNLLRDNGYTIIDIDYRASKGYGRDFRTAIYQHMGGKDLSDQVDGRQFLIDSLGIDPNRIGMYGGSYGGFITLMALLTEPGKFQAGAALRSVTDWTHYNHEYASNILNYPSTDPKAYRRSSPIYFAENLQDRLLMLHGMVDDNVQFQDVVRMSQRFIELEKENWELAVFPVEAHGFKKSSSWTDEYRRIFELFNEELLIDKK